MDRERRLRRACPRVHGAAAEHEPQHSVATACVMQKEGVLKLRRRGGIHLLPQWDSSQ
jgi:hypothetical protein